MVPLNHFLFIARPITDFSTPTPTSKPILALVPAQAPAPLSSLNILSQMILTFPNTPALVTFKPTVTCILAATTHKGEHNFTPTTLPLPPAFSLHQILKKPRKLHSVLYFTVLDLWFSLRIWFIYNQKSCLVTAHTLFYKNSLKHSDYFLIRHQTHQKATKPPQALLFFLLQLNN